MPIPAPAGEETSDQTSTIWASDDPIEYSGKLLEISAKLFPRIQQLQKKLYIEELEAAKKRERGKTDFSAGDYVLIAVPNPASLDFHWSGPGEIVAPESESMYKVRSLVDKQVSRIHVSRLFPYNSGDLPKKDLQGLAAYRKLLCETVFEHRLVEGQLYFFCKWLGQPLQERSNPDSWLSWKECRFCPPVRDYCLANNLHPRLHQSSKA